VCWPEAGVHAEHCVELMNEILTQRDQFLVVGKRHGWFLLKP
jgi:hypothetical protein